jgi:hypothetical protein
MCKSRRSGQLLHLGQCRQRIKPEGGQARLTFFKNYLIKFFAYNKINLVSVILGNASCWENRLVNKYK